MDVINNQIAGMVAPSPGRGLKHIENIKIGDQVGRPFTGAWIETQLRPSRNT